jgi:hypothetical protein
LRKFSGLVFKIVQYGFMAARIQFEDRAASSPAVAGKIAARNRRPVKLASRTKD